MLPIWAVIVIVIVTYWLTVNNEQNRVTQYAAEMAAAKQKALDAQKV